MKKLMSVVIALAIIVGVGVTVMPMSVGAASNQPLYRHGGHHGGQRSAAWGGFYRNRDTEADREAYLERRQAAFEKYVDDLVEDGTLTKKEGANWKTDADRKADFFAEYPSYGGGTYGTGYCDGTGRGHHRNSSRGHCSRW